MEIILILLLAIACIGAALYLAAMYQVCWAFVPEGQIIVAMAGENAIRYLGNIRGHKIDPHTGEITPLANPTDSDVKGTLLREHLGIYWIGLWPFVQVHKRKLRKMRYAKKDGGSQFEIVPFDREVDSLYFQDQIPVIASGAETNEKIPVDIKMLVTFVVRNAERALFKNDPIVSLTASTDAVARDFVGNKQLSELTEMSHSAGGMGGGGTSSQFIQAMMDLNLDMSPFGGNKSVIELYGVEIIAVVFLSYEIKGNGMPTDPVTAATTKAYVARQEAEATEVKGLAEAKVAEAKAIAEVAGVTKMVADLKSLSDRKASAIALGHAIEKHQGTLVIGSQTPFIATEETKGKP